MAFNVQRKLRVYDVMHRGSVYTCVGITVLGHIYLGYRAVKYYWLDRPELRKDELLRIKSIPDKDETLAA